MLAEIRSYAFMALFSIWSAIQRLLKYIPSTIYDVFISRMLTIYSYERLVVQMQKRRADDKDKRLRILDVGVGTGVPLHSVWNMLPEDCEVLGVDIDHSYILKAQRLFKSIMTTPGTRHVEMREMNFYSLTPETFGKFDIIVFSSSFMLMPDKEKALELAKQMLSQNGSIYFILTLQSAAKKNSQFLRIVEYIKPKIKYLTTIDFGKLTYEDDFEFLLKQASLKTTWKERLQKKANFPTKIFRVFIYETIPWKQ